MAAKFTESEEKEIKEVFNSFDADGSGQIDAKELTAALKQLKLEASESHVKELIAEVDADKSGTVDWHEFLDIAAHVKSGKKDASSGFAKVYTKQKELIKVEGAVGQRFFAQEEMDAFASHLNNCLGKDEDLKHLMPIGSGIDLCKKVKDGLLLSKFINCAVPDTIDVRALNRPKGGKAISVFQIQENQTLCIKAATSIGVHTVNVGASEMMEGEKFVHIVLGMVWQLVKIQLLNSINLKNHPELIRLLEPGETLEDLLKLPPDLLLLRWFNWHLKNAGYPKKITNFSGDVKDSEAYTVLLNQLAPNTCDKGALKESDHTTRAAMVLANAKKLEVDSFIKPNDIVKGNPRLNLAFTAAIFNQCPGLDPVTEEEIKKVGLMEDDTGDSREERAFRMWINSLGIDGVYVNNLFDDCRDGLVLLRVMDKVQPGIVAWKKVEMQPNNKFKKIANCNYVVVLGKQLKFSLVGIGGSDITDGNKKLLLALVWQLMRFHTLKFLAEVQAKRFGGKEVTDQMIIDWANEAVQKAGKHSKMSSFKDSELRTGVFFLDLLYSIDARIIDSEFVTDGQSDDNALLNAKYSISIARKLGATIFLLPEDIVEVKPKMILTFVASIMSLAK